MVALYYSSFTKLKYPKKRQKKQQNKTRHKEKKRRIHYNLFICWITFPADLKSLDLFLKKLIRRQIVEKFPNTGILLFPLKKPTFMLLICRILNKYNSKVLFEH